MKWYLIPGTNERYSISKEGLIRNNATYKIWPGTKTYQGYFELCIEYKRVRVYRKLVHLILAELFLSKPAGDYVIDHVDNNKQNNNLSNLRYVSRQENARKGQQVRDASTTCKAVAQYSLEGCLVATYPSVKEACIAIGVNHRSPLISYACKGRCSTNNCNTAYGYLWRFIDDDIVLTP